MSDIAAINMTDRLVFTDDGETLPIIDAFDDDGDDCDLDDAVSCVAGPDSEGMWWTIDLTCFGDAVVQ